MTDDVEILPAHPHQHTFAEENESVKEILSAQVCG